MKSVDNLKTYIVVFVLAFIAADFLAGKSKATTCHVNNRTFVPGHSEVTTHKDSKSKTTVSTNWVSDKYWLFINADGDYYKVQTTMSVYSYSTEHPDLIYEYREGLITGIHYIQNCKPNKEYQYERKAYDSSN